MDTLRDTIVPYISILWCLIVIIDHLLGNVTNLSVIKDEWASMTLITSTLFIILFSTVLVKDSRLKLGTFTLLVFFSLITFILGLIFEDRTYISSLATSMLFIILGLHGIFSVYERNIYVRFAITLIVYMISNIALIFYFLDPTILYELPGFESVSWNTATGFLLYASTMLSTYYSDLIQKAKFPNNIAVINERFLDRWFLTSFYLPIAIIFSISLLHFLGLVSTKTGMAFGLFFVCLIPFPLTYIIYIKIMDISISTYLKNQKIFHREQDIRFHNELLEEFAQITSHNLRGPLISLKNLADYGQSDDKQKDQILQLTADKVETLTNTVDSLAEFYNMIRTGQINYSSCDIKFFFNNAMLICLNSYDLQEENVHIKYDLNVSTVEYPEVYFENISYNLISNAFKYRDPARPLVINVSAETFDQDGVRLIVRDNGMGINLKYFKEKIFKFGSTYHNLKNSKGVGLFIVKNQLARLGDTIVVESTEGKFTEFVIELNKNGKKELGYS